ncbi:MAG: MFS transporter [Bacteroidales bacterium]|nr:MFS transporter [Bacteroidales bacterium]
MKRVVVVALMAVFTLAVCFVILGSVSVELMEDLGIKEDAFGSLVMALFLTGLITQPFIGPLVDKYGHKPMATIGFAVVGGSMFLLAFAPSYAIAMLASILLGFGAMALNTVGNTLIPAVLYEGKDPARASNFGNVFFGIGYVLTPLLFTLFLQALSYSAALSIVGALVIFFLIISLTTSYPQIAFGFKLSMAINMLKKVAVIVGFFALFFYLALEIIMTSWGKPLMTELFGGGSQASYNAGVILSFFGVTLTLGRFLASRIKNLTAIGAKMIVILSLISVASIIVMILTDSAVLAVIAFLVTGLVFGPIFPNIVGITFARFDPKFHGSIFGIIFTGGLLGSTFAPKIVGNISAGEATVQESLLIAAVMAGVLFIIAFFLGKKKKSESTE